MHEAAVATAGGGGTGLGASSAPGAAAMVVERLGGRCCPAEQRVHAVGGGGRRPPRHDRLTAQDEEQPVGGLPEGDQGRVGLILLEAGVRRQLLTNVGCEGSEGGERRHELAHQRRLLLVPRPRRALERLDHTRVERVHHALLLTPHHARHAKHDRDLSEGGARRVHAHLGRARPPLLGKHAALDDREARLLRLGPHHHLPGLVSCWDEVADGLVDVALVEATKEG